MTRVLITLPALLAVVSGCAAPILDSHEFGSWCTTDDNCGDVQNALQPRCIWCAISNAEDNGIPHRTYVP